ncbi:MAG: hypothetical protein AAFU85_03670 [Planctomycetota bacterium]
MSDRSDKSIEKFYRSFRTTGDQFEPIDEVNRDETQNLKTFYRAQFDQDERLTNFAKYLRPDLDSEAVVEFTERYQYSSAGELLAKSVSTGRHTRGQWKVISPDSSSPSFENELACHLFSDSSEPSTAGKLWLLNEQINHLEIEFFKELGATKTPDQVAFKCVSELVDFARHGLASFRPGTNVRVCAAIMGDQDGLSLGGFDEFEIPIPAILMEWSDQAHIGSTPAGLLVDVQQDLDEKTKSAFREMGISTIVTHPVLTSEAGATEELFSIYLIADQTLEYEHMLAWQSVARRLAGLIQFIVWTGMNTQHTPSERLSE